ncbi:hypothetical protein ACICHK_02520 [Streptomyces sp. AHU1]|uniref:hypothetical protein n=1 Tax=Streptomyces sp. AHU1 TaxID=3377215 RepID=UPI003877D0A0
MAVLPAVDGLESSRGVHVHPAFALLLPLLLVEDALARPVTPVVAEDGQGRVRGAPAIAAGTQ